MIAVEGTGFKEITSYGNDYYIPRWDKDIDDSKLDKLKSEILDKTKNDIVDSAIKAFDARVKQSKTDSKSTKMLEKLVGGKAFKKGLDAAFLIIPDQTNTNNSDNISESDIEKFLNNYQSFVNELINLCNQYIGNKEQYDMLTKGIVDAYYDGIYPETVFGRDLLNKVLMHEEAKGSLSNKEIPSSVYRAVAVLKSLPDPTINYWGQQYTAKSGNGADEINQFEEILSQKMQGWIKALSYIGSERVVVIGLNGADKKFQKGKEVTEGKWKTSGTERVMIDIKDLDTSVETFLGKERMQQYHLKEKDGKQLTKVTKLDARYEEYDDKIVIGSGITIKDYKSINIANATHANIHLQGGTPFVTLLLREAGITGDALYGMIVTAAIKSNGNTKKWDTIIQNAKYLALLDVLAGSKWSVEDQAYYMIINKRLFSIGDILNHIKNSNSSMSMYELRKKNVAKAGGLEKSTYEAYNKNNNSITNTMAAASARSKDIYTKSLETMYKTKISISMNLQDLRRLVEEKSYKMY